MSSLVDLLNEHTPAVPPFGRILVIAALFAVAWLVSRAAGWIASVVVRRDEATRAAIDDTGILASLRQRETAISLARTLVGVVMYGLAVLLSIGVVVGADRFQTLVGASFVVILLAFSAQRVLTDAIAGVLMFQERWFRIGDTVVIEPWKIQGVVEGMTLRSVAVRSVGGELMRVSNSEVKAVRVLPRGYHRFDAELFVTDETAARELVHDVARIVPTGPTHFVTRPFVVESEPLGDDLHRLRLRVAVPVGREWLAEELLPRLLGERAPDSLIVHGPVVLRSDELAEAPFARATRTALAAAR
jgi:small-conductance mechanosensitive channel